MATPEVAGAAALVLSHDLTLTPWQVRAKLMAGADRVDGLKGKVTSGGRLDVYGAISVAAAARRRRAARRRALAPNPRTVATTPTTPTPATPAVPTTAPSTPTPTTAAPTTAATKHDAGDGRRPPRAERHPGARRPRRAEAPPRGPPEGVGHDLRARDCPLRAAPRRPHREAPAPHEARVRRRADRHRPRDADDGGHEGRAAAPHERREARARPCARASRSRCAPRRPTRRATPARAAPRSR